MLAGVLACTVESISYYPTVARMCGNYVKSNFIIRLNKNVLYIFKNSFSFYVKKCIETNLSNA